MWGGCLPGTPQMIRERARFALTGCSDFTTIGRYVKVGDAVIYFALCHLKVGCPTKTAYEIGLHV